MYGRQPENATDLLLRAQAQLDLAREKADTVQTKLNIIEEILAYMNVQIALLCVHVENLQSLQKKPN